MKKEMLNGIPIPYELPIEDLQALMSSSVMKDFSLACEALSYKNEPEAYQILKSHINDRDKYRRLYVLKTIFRCSEATELIDDLENAIASDDFLFVENGLKVISDYRIKVSDSLLLSVVDRHLPKLCMAICALNTLDISDGHYAELVKLFMQAKQCIQRELIGEILVEKYLPTKSGELFELFSRDGFAKIRLLALKIARQYGYNLSKFLSDMDGHVRKLAGKSLGDLSFLVRYISKYRVDVSDDLESAIIYNPGREDHLYIEYDKTDGYSPYMLSFSFQHIHETDQERAAEWIDGILNEAIFSIEYFRRENRCFGGQIHASALQNLTYEFLEQDTECCGITKLFNAVDSFKVRGWTGKNDFDGYFVRTDDGIHIEIVSKA